MQRFSLYGVHKRDYQESVTTGQTDARTHRQTPDKVIPMCRYASQATQKLCISSILSVKRGITPKTLTHIDDTPTWSVAQ